MTAKKIIPPVIALGASAGGVEALERFFSNLPSNTGFAYVVIIHMDPDHKSVLAELIQYYTQMKIQTVTRKTLIKPDHIFIKTSDRILKVDGNSLVPELPKTRNEMIYPIDLFFTSLAESQRNNATGIILSGTGKDGMKGIREIKRFGGITIAQEPSTAQYAHMPENAIQTGNVDYIIPVINIPATLLKVITPRPLSRSLSYENEHDDLKTKEYIDKILNLLFKITGNDFRLYKYNTIYRRIDYRLKQHHLNTLAQYYKYIKKNTDEIHALSHDILIRVTNFFRDPEAFSYIQTEIIPELCSRNKKDVKIRVWSAGCGTGEEAYTCAILFKEHLSKMKGKDKPGVLIFASDIDKDSIAYARSGMYPLTIKKDISKKILEKYFYLKNDQYCVVDEIREMIVFSEHDMIQDPAFSKLDLILCRNVLIYMRAELQRKIIPLFHYSLNPASYLVLGSSESIGECQDIFNTIEKKWKIYRKTDAEISVSMRYTISPSSSVPINSFPHEGDHYYTFSDIEALANRIILSTYSSPHVIVDRNHRIVYFSSNTNPYLKHQTGKANLDIIQMAVGKLKLELRTALFQVMKDNKKYLKDSVTVKLKSGYRKIRIIIEPLVLSTKSNNSQEKYYLIVFDEFENVHAAGLDIDDDSISSENTKDQIILQMENELISTKEYLNKVINDYNVSIEELKASNEEILSMNEELQSTNEELQTSKEELQMLNDELTRVNSQLNGKINELTQSKNDINNLFSSTEIATIFLDNNLCIKRFTPATTEIFNFITEDIGRPIEHFSNKINYSTLMDDAREIIKSLSRIEREITAPGKRFFLVRLVPYRTDSNVIEGIVITFTDITKIKNYQSEIRKSEERLRTIFDHTVQSFILIDENGKIIAVNKVAHSMTMDIFGKEITEGEFITQYDILDNMPSDLLTFYKSALNGIENNISISMQKTSDQLAYYNCSFSPVVDDNRAISGVLLVITDISEQKKWENELLKAKEIAELASKVKTQFLSNMSHEIRTPLNGILGMNSLLLKSTLSDDQMTYVRNIHVSGEILLSLINNILDLSKIESGQRTIKREVINFHKILDDVIKSFEECIKTKNLTLTCSVDSRIPDVLYGDALSITQIFNNLINNAYKFTETGTIDIYAKVKEITEDNLIIETTVSDTGIGISSENIEGIFERYTQIDCTYAKKFAGAGLGLSIVKSLVDLLKGNISVISEEGKGSNFTVILPFETADVSIPSKQSGVAMPSGVITPGLDILIVEDNAINQLALARTLKHYKCNVETASNGQDAQTILREKALDCVLMDIQMPVMDGIQCLKLLREGNTINRDVPVIALTGYAMAHDESNFLYIGFNSYITKPINENKLIMEIHRLARKH